MAERQALGDDFFKSIFAWLSVDLVCLFYQAMFKERGEGGAEKKKAGFSLLCLIYFNVAYFLISYEI